MERTRAHSRIEGPILRELARELVPARERPRVLVFSHERPDGDAVGSCLALVSILRALGRRAEAVLADEIPRRYRFLRGADRVLAPTDVRSARGAIAVALDTADAARLAGGAGLFEAASRKTVIDHHISNALFGDANWVDPGASSVGEMIWHAAKALSWRVPEDAREALYVAILTDTGRFSYGNTTPRALESAAELVESGVDPERMAENVYGRRTLAEWELEARARSSLRLAFGGRVALMELSAEDFRLTRTGPSAANDLAALTRTLEGVDIGLFLYEIDGGARTKVGIRTSRTLDANRLAARLGGGGHKQAAGCVIEGPLGRSRRRMLEEIRRFLHEAEGSAALRTGRTKGSEACR